MDPRCKGCRYNTPRTQNGEGRLCNGYTMTEHDRCPEWVINEYVASVRLRTWTMTDVIEFNRVFGLRK